MEYRPYEYQVDAEKFILENENCGTGLILDMGSGKTLISLSAVEQLLRDYFSVAKVLVIAPLEPAKNTWPAEIEKWDHLKGLTYSIVIGAPQKRLEALNVSADIYIVNTDNVVWLVEYYKKRWPFECVIIDELSKFKSASSKRFKALRKVRPLIRTLVGLTGTPAANGYLGLWSQVYLLDQGEALGKTLTDYRERYFSPDKRNATTIFSWKLKDGAEEEIFKAIESCCLSIQSLKHLDLPELLYSTHEVVLSKKVKEQYEQLERDAILSFMEGDIDAGNAGILTNKLLQMCGGAVYDEFGGVKLIHDEKMKKLEQLIEAADGHPVFVLYAYKHERDRIIAKFPEAVEVKTPRAIARWNAGEVSILLAHPASAGHGLNLQFGGHIAIWFNWTHDLELYGQASKRLHRPGQTQPVLIHHICTRDGLDTYVLNDVLSAKKQSQDRLIEALRAKIKKKV